MSKKAAEKTRKEHYVPRCYLRRWKNSKEQVYVYDKRLKKARINNVYDVACERFYYDIDYHELSEDKIAFLKSIGINPENDEQFIEHFLAEYIEESYSKILAKIVDKEVTPWHEKNCYFVNNQDRLELALFLVFQYIRTKETRDSIVDSSNCLEQLLKEMHCSKETIDQYTIKQKEEQIIQGNLLLDIDHIVDLMQSFWDLTWILGINRTDVPFYTSDNPIGTCPHIKHPIMSMAGIGSKGVEVFLPLSPNHILLMFDGSYHTEISRYNGRYVSLDDIDDIEHYNRLCTYNSSRCVFSSNSDFSIIENILLSNPNVFEIPKVSISFGGKEYFPK